MICLECGNDEVTEGQKMCLECLENTIKFMTTTDNLTAPVMNKDKR